MTYRRRPSPLHATRAVVGALWCLAVVTVGLSVHHPVVLGALIAAVVAAGAAALVPRPVALALALSAPFAVLIVVFNALATRDGLTVVYRLGGPWDVTLEAIVQGGVYALTAAVLFGAAALYSAAVDPDDLLRAFRRLSFSSALTAALATRMVPVLARDARRLSDAQRSRGGAPASRMALMRAVSANAMDRALDVAATLEVRGFRAERDWSTARRVPALARPWSRHDGAFAASAVGLFALAGAGRALAPFAAYPRLSVPLDGGVALVAGLVVLALLAPFADRRGI